MADRGILFSAPMVRALLAGRKSQTRRMLPIPAKVLTAAEGRRGEWEASTVGGPGVVNGRGELVGEMPCVWHTGTAAIVVPPYRVSDRMWVRESYSGPGNMTGIPPRDWANDLPIWRWADGNPDDGDWTKPKPGMHMPRWASRLTLIVTDVRVQRLQEIGVADAVAEGIERNAVQDGTWLDYPKGGSAAGWADPRRSFKSLWNSLHGPDAWDANPWVVATTFTVRRGNIDAAREESRHDR